MVISIYFQNQLFKNKIFISYERCIEKPTRPAPSSAALSSFVNPVKIFIFMIPVKIIRGMKPRTTKVNFQLKKNAINNAPIIVAKASSVLPIFGPVA